MFRRQSRSRRLGWAVLACAAVLWTQATRAGTLARPGAEPGQSDAESCQALIPAAEAGARIPRGLLTAIGIVESGRPSGRNGRVTPWPWTINVAGVGYVFPSKDEAIDAVNKARASGIQSIDVGCMQINLLHHPNAFASLEQAFDPQANVIYAASFLSRLFVETGAWPDAAAAYHSRTPGLADTYRQSVMARWPLAAKYAPAPVVDDGNRLPALRSRLMEMAADGDALAAAGVLPTRREASRAAANGLAAGGLAARRGERLNQLAAAGSGLSAARLH